MLLRELTRTTHALHEAQVLQLKLVPRVLVTNSISSEFAVDFESKNIVFTIRTKGKLTANQHGNVIPHKTAANCLAEYVQKLLGGEWNVTVEVKNAKQTKRFIYGATHER